MSPIETKVLRFRKPMALGDAFVTKIRNAKQTDVYSMDKLTVPAVYGGALPILAEG